jgi:glutathione S-transferase
VCEIGGMKLVIGNKNYSSWSMRPWLLMKHAGIPFVEERLSFKPRELFAEKALRYSPSGLVPVLVDGELAVWDTLAIVEYLAERFPEQCLWPDDTAARATARSVCAEMHAGFRNLRERMCQNITARLPGRGWDLKVQRDIDRIVSLWTDARARFGAAGPFLFGRFSIADAYFAPVTRRFVTYDVPLPAEAARYVETIALLPATQQWIADAETENEFVDFDEPYRAAP